MLGICRLVEVKDGALGIGHHLHAPDAGHVDHRRVRLAAETRGSSVRVLIGRPDNDHLTQVLPDRNAGFVADAYDITRHANDEQGGLAHHIAALFDPPDEVRRAG